MKIDVFTVRNKSTNELIYAEGTSCYNEYCSDFTIDGKWLTEAEKSGWYKSYQGLYGFDREIRFLLDYEYEFIVFSMEEVEVNT